MNFGINQPILITPHKLQELFKPQFSSVITTKNTHQKCAKSNATSPATTKKQTKIVLSKKMKK